MQTEKAGNVLTVRSTFPMNVTMNRLSTEVLKRNLLIFATLDFGGDAARMGLRMQPKQMLISGNPRVSDDNAFVESVFRTAKYRPEFPTKGFADVTAARSWATNFVHWYNHEHAHSGIRYVSPAQRHTGDDVAILQKRHELYQRARDANPRRWSRSTRDWTPITVVTLNPERDYVVQEITDQRASRAVA